MGNADRVDELFTLKTIAETLNQCVDLDEMLPSVLEKLLQVTELKTGWIFLVKDRPHYSCVADHRLPPALEWENKKPMRHMSCWCLDKFWSGQLQQAVNIMECKRLEDAVTYQWGDTQNLTHHATVPLMASGKRFGLLNVGSPGKEHFTEKELTLLQSVAFQIGTAVERINLFEAQKQRAEYFTQLDELTRVLWKINNIRVLPEKVVQHIARHFQWPVISLFLIKNQQLRLESLFYKGEAVVTTKIDHKLSLTNAHVIKSAMEQQNIALGQEKLAFLPDVREKNTWHAAAVPLILSDKPIGLLYVAQTTDNPLSETERDVLKALGDHLSLLIETIRLHEQKQEMLLVEERNRLARDLHDSVNQKLFSLSLMARGAKECLPTDPQLVGESLEEIQTLSKEALADMRSLIWQLRPANVEAGIMTTLKQYGQKIGLKINDEVEGIAQLPRRVEETLWRIGQEALNNIRKHARTNVATIKLTIDKKQIRLSIIDDGCGFNPHEMELKDVEPDILVEAIKKTVSGEKALHSQVTHQLVTHVTSQEESAVKFSSLTPREKDVLYHITLGKSNKEIAADLKIEVNCRQSRRDD